jgi:hypothetical protein
MTPGLERYLTQPMAPPDPRAIAAIEAGPMNPLDVLLPTSFDRLLDPTELPVETGWCWTPDHVAYVAVRTPMPGTTGAMWDWWFDWHAHDPLRYRIWFPGMHFGNRLVPRSRPRAKPFWGATHFPDEDIGTGREHLRIEFKAPTEYGFTTDALQDPRVATIVGGHVGSASRHVRFGVMTHVFLNAPDGIVLRSRFHNGAVLRPDLPGVVGDLAGVAINRAAVRRLTIPRDTPRALALHCAREYAHLAAILPELYSEYGPG